MLLSLILLIQHKDFIQKLLFAYYHLLDIQLQKNHVPSQLVRIEANGNYILFNLPGFVYLY